MSNHRHERSFDDLKEHMVDKQSDSLDGFESFGLAADHFDINKVIGPDDKHFKLVRSKILDFLGDSTTYKRDLYSGLQYAADAWDSSTLEELIELDADPNSYDDDGYSPLYSATKRGNVNAVRLLVKAGAKIDAGRDGSYTPLQAAADEGHLAVVKELVDRHADIDSQFASNPRTPLFFAASAGHYEIVRLLLRARANHNVRGPGDRTPLHAAASMGHLNVTRALLATPGIHVEAIISKHNQTPLHRAAQEGYSNIVRVLLNANARVEVKDRDDMTPLRLAATAGHDNVVRTLISLGSANVEARGKHGYTALHNATMAGQQDVVETLLNAGANPDAQAIDGATALHLCRHAGIAMLLIDFRADRKAPDNRGRTPLSIAKKEWNTDVMEVLQCYSPKSWKEISRSSPSDSSIVPILVSLDRKSESPREVSPRDEDISRSSLDDP